MRQVFSDGIMSVVERLNACSRALLSKAGQPRKEEWTLEHPTKGDGDLHGEPLALR
jgi:hypothetical protein